MLDLLARPDTWIALATLSAMEIVLGIDNVVFLTILAGRLPASQQPAGRRLGLAFALLTRLGLLFAITWVMGLTRELFSVAGHGVSGRDLILLLGGLFLIAKATHEIHDKLEVRHEEEAGAGGGKAVFWMVIAQIAVLDLVFSLDSVITAVGMAQHLPVMVTAMVAAVGVMLVAESFGRHIEKGYVYFAMAFSLGVELLNMRMRKARNAPLALHHRFEAETHAKDGPPSS